MSEMTFVIILTKLINLTWRCSSYIYSMAAGFWHSPQLVQGQWICARPAELLNPDLRSPRLSIQAWKQWNPRIQEAQTELVQVRISLFCFCKRTISLIWSMNDGSPQLSRGLWSVLVHHLQKPVSSVLPWRDWTVPGWILLAGELWQGHQSSFNQTATVTRRKWLHHVLRLKSDSFKVVGPEHVPTVHFPAFLPEPPDPGLQTLLSSGNQLVWFLQNTEEWERTPADSVSYFLFLHVEQRHYKRLVSTLRTFDFITLFQRLLRFFIFHLTGVNLLTCLLSWDKDRTTDTCLQEVRKS